MSDSDKDRLEFLAYWLPLVVTYCRNGLLPYDEYDELYGEYLSLLAKAEVGR